MDSSLLEEYTKFDLCLEVFSLVVNGYVDANYASWRETRKSTIWYIFTFGSGVVS